MLTEEQIEELRSEFSRLLSESRIPINATKKQCRTVLINIDSWIQSNAASFMNVIPSVLTPKQGLRLFKAIINKRMEIM